MLAVYTLAQQHSLHCSSPEADSGTLNILTLLEALERYLHGIEIRAL